MLWQPTLYNDLVTLVPLMDLDFDEVYQVASDPLIWEQHPNPDRYKEDVFKVFFEGALQSGGAFKIIDARSNQIIGCTRFYDHDPKTSQVLIGYTFMARDHWGSTYNQAVKYLMLHYAFQFVDHVVFHIGAINKRSQIAIERLGAVKTGELEVAYFGEKPKINFVYQINKGQWLAKNN